MVFLFFLDTFRIEFLWLKALLTDGILSRPVMVFARRPCLNRKENNTNTRWYPVAPEERVSDVWPDWSTQLGESELADSAGKNRPVAVLLESVELIAIPFGIVAFLIIIVNVLNIW